MFIPILDLSDTTDLTFPLIFNTGTADVSKEQLEKAVRLIIVNYNTV